MEIIKRKDVSDVSVVVVNYNGKHLLKDCLSSLYEINYPRDHLKVKLVDNCSADDSLSYVRKNFPYVDILKNDRNNYCRAVNLGIRSSSSEYISLLNNDTVVDKNWLVRLVDVMNGDGKVGCCGSKVLLPDGRIQSAGHYEFPNFYWGDKGLREPDIGQYDLLEEKNTLSCSSVLFRNDCLRDVGNFDEDFIMYLEDVDIFLRCRQKGWKIFYVPKSIVYHKLHGTADEDTVRFYIERNRLLLIAKHFPKELPRALENRQHSLRQEELFKILPDMFLKIIKHHSPQSVDPVMHDFFLSLQRLYNLSKDQAVQTLTNLRQEAEKIKDDTQRQKSDLEERAAKLDSQLQSGLAQIETLKKSLQEKTVILDESSRVKEGLEQRLLESEQIKENSRREISNLENVILRLGEKIEAKYIQIETLKESLQEKISVLDEVSAAKSALESGLNQRTKELESLSSELSQTIKQRDNFSVEIARYAQELKQKSAESEKLKSQLDQASAQRDSLSTEINRQAEELKQKSAEHETLKSEISQVILQRDGLYGEINRQAQELKQKSAESEKLKSQLDQASAQRDSLSTEINRQAEELKQKNQEISALNYKLIELRHNIDLQQVESAHREKAIADMGKQCEGLLGETKASAAVIKSKECEIQSLNITLVADKHKLYLAQMELINLRKDFRQLESQRNSLVSEISRKIEDINRKASETEDLRIKLQDLSEKLRMQENSAKALLSDKHDLENKIRSAGLELEAKLQIISSQEQTILKQGAQIDTLNKNIETSEIELGSLKAECLNRDKHIEGLRREIDAQANVIKEGNALIDRILHSRTYRYIALPAWRLLDFLKSLQAKFKTKKKREILVIKPYYVSVDATEKALEEFRRLFPEKRIALFANVFKPDYDRLRNIQSVDEKILFSPDYRRLTALRLIRTIFIFNLRYFDESVLLIGAPVYHGYRKAKLFTLAASARISRSYHTVTNNFASLYSCRVTDKIRVTAHLISSIFIFSGLVLFFTLFIVIPIKIRKILHR